MKWISCALLLLAPTWLVAAAPVADPDDSDTDQFPHPDCGVTGHTEIVRLEHNMFRIHCLIESKNSVRSDSGCGCWNGYVRGLLARPTCQYNDRTRTWVAEGSFAVGWLPGAEAHNACNSAVLCVRAAAGCGSGHPS